MLVNLKRFNGVTLNISGIQAVILNAGMSPNANPVFIEQAQADQNFSGAYSVNVRDVAVQLTITDATNRDAHITTIKGEFKRGMSGPLEATFSDNGLDYLLNCVVVTPPTQNTDFPNMFTVVLQTGDSAWRAVTADTDSWSVTGTGGTKVVDAGLGEETALIASLTATTNPTVGYLYQNIYRLVDVPAVNYGNRSWCLTVDCAALIGAGKMQADCDDLRIILDGKETKRWIGTVSATTNIWFNITLGPGYSLILDTAIAATGDITTMTFKKTAASLAVLKALPNRGILYDGTEWLSWNGKTVNKYQLKRIKRRIFGTTWQAHATGSTFKYIQHTIVMKYGNSAVSAPSLTDPNYDIDKPQFDLTSSTNLKWVDTTATKFYDPDYPSKGGSWTPVLSVLGDVSEYYMITGNAETGDPAIGALLSCWLKQGINQTEKGRVGFMMGCAGGFFKITLTGRKYRSTARWPAFSGLQRSINGKVWYNVWVDAKPTLNATWTALATHSAVSITTTSKYIFFGIDGTITVLTNAFAMLEGLTATVEFYSTNLPTGAFLGETTSFNLDIALSNQATGDIIYLDYPMIQTKVFLLDSENSVATFDEQNMHDAMALNDEGRSVWLRLSKGSNTLELISPDCGTLTIALSWYRRRP